jgi:hypothetical protein
MSSIPLAEAILLLNINKKISGENQSQMNDSIVYVPLIFGDSDSKGNSSDYVPERIAASLVNSGRNRDKLPTPTWEPTSYEDDSDFIKKSDTTSASVTATIAATSDNVKSKVTISSSSPKVRRSSLSSLSSSSSSSINFSDGPGCSSTVSLKQNNKDNIEKNDKKRAKRIVEKSDYDDQCFCKIVADYGFEKIKVALVKYKEINGDLFVERNFTVPRSTLWPEEIWDINLGNVVTGIKVGTLSFFRRNEFLELGLIVRDDEKYKDSNGTSRHNERQLDLISLGLITELDERSITELDEGDI